MIRVRELREKIGLQQKQLAIDLGVSQPTVCDWEGGKKEPSFRSAIKIAEYFNVSTDYLLGRSDDPTPPNETRTIADDDIKFALTGGLSKMTDAQYEEVKRYARYIVESGDDD